MQATATRIQIAGCHSCVDCSRSGVPHPCAAVNSALPFAGVSHFSKPETRPVRVREEVRCALWPALARAAVGEVRRPPGIRSSTSLFQGSRTQKFLPHPLAGPTFIFQTEKLMTRRIIQGASRADVQHLPESRWRRQLTATRAN
jgi:hypothetical protein